MTQTVLVTGGAGFIGSHLVDALVARGDRVRILDNLHPQAHPSGKPDNVHPEAELLLGDVRDRPTVERALEGVELVFHQAGLVGNGQSMYELRQYMDVNAVGTATLLEAILARRAQIQRLVVASSMVVYGDGAYACPEHGALPGALRLEERLRARRWEPICPRCRNEVVPIATNESHPLAPNSVYGVSKRDQEELCLVVGRAYEVPTVALRYLNTYGSRQVLGNPYTGVAAIVATRVLNGQSPIVFEDGEQLRDFTHVSDVVQANLAAAAADSRAWYRAFNVGTGRSTRIVDVVRAVTRALGSELEPRITGEFRKGDIRHCFADVAAARDLLGFEARVSFDEGAAELGRWASSQSPQDPTDAAHDELRRRALLG